MEFTTLPLSQLHQWEGNLQTYGAADILLLKEKLEKKKQFKPLFVTPDDDGGTYSILAGNKRYVAYQQMGVEKVWVSIIEFFQKDDGLWYAKRDGEEETERYQTKEDGMQDWSLVDNEHYGNFDWDKFANVSHGYNLDWSKYMMGSKTKRVSTALNEFLMSDKIKKTQELECPSCHFIADKEDFKQPTAERG